MKLSEAELLEILNRYEYEEIAENCLTTKNYINLLKELNLDNLPKELNDYYLNSRTLGNYEIVEHYAGGEGEYTFKVIYFKDHDIYVKIEGAYYSYHGTNWENPPFVVKPIQKVVTVYE